MADVFAPHDEDDALRDIGGVIAGALEMTPDEHQLDADDNALSVEERHAFHFDRRRLRLDGWSALLHRYADETVSRYSKVGGVWTHTELVSGLQALEPARRIPREHRAQ